ncbi:hypothetical protein HO133_005968 [Letharia lupina]|uniref:ELYS-like domain-containing protein n=1 Tax=Letharia lupina TaxID=560253 RepID=A0A8H6F7Z0_9LECA|nr:uncharacterized protein HO133_005968 [Letharia lupina]KAF6218617.1 hypothetical protein HO133_005968 [Letharia lupina]
MDDSDDFEVVFGNNSNIAYEKPVADDIKQRRRSLENELFIDRLLKALGVQKVSRSYPAESHENLRLLHEQIISSSSPDHHKHSALYYLLKDLHKYSHQSPRDFANSSYLPGKYRTFIDGIWYLDRLEFEKALDYLTEPALVPTFPEEILYTLCRHAPDATLPIAYYQTVSPAITSGKVLETYCLTLCRVSLTEAFYFSRTQGDLNHRVLFEKLINFVHASSHGAIRATRGVELIDLPLSEGEESWFTDFLEDGKGRNLAGANDTLIMRAIATGRSESVSRDRRKWNGHKIDGVDWNTLRGGIRSS